MQYNLLRKRFERRSHFKLQVFIYSNEEDVAIIFLFYFNKICNMLLSKLTAKLSCVITENNLYLNLLVANLMGFF